MWANFVGKKAISHAAFSRDNYHMNQPPKLLDAKSIRKIMKFLELFFSTMTASHTPALRRRRRRKNVKGFSKKFAQLLQKILFFRVPFGCVNKNSKCFLVKLCDQQEERKFSPFLSSKIKKCV